MSEDQLGAFSEALKNDSELRDKLRISTYKALFMTAKSAGYSLAADPLPESQLKCGANYVFEYHAGVLCIPLTRMKWKSSTP